MLFRSRTAPKGVQTREIRREKATTGQRAMGWTARHCSCVLALCALCLALPATAGALTKQKITFKPKAPNPALVGGSYAVEATASSGLPVTITATPEAVCKLTASTVEFLAE